jgi:2-hydroxy-4-(methylsulfanyl)butanoate S-methyltransferase
VVSQENPSIAHLMPQERSDAISGLSAIAYGFMGSQALFAALELDLFTALSDEPCGLDDLAKRLGTPAGPLSVLLSACLALGLLSWGGQRYRNSRAAQRFLVSTARSYVGDYYLRQISAVLYDRMRLIRPLLRGEPTEALAYATTLNSPQVTEEFIRGQHGGSLAPASRLARTLDLSRYTRLLDLGGGSGAFAIEAVKRYRGLSAVVFDLPQVVRVTEKFIQESGLEKSSTCSVGDLRTDAWPGGADLILLSYIVSCYEPETLRALLKRCLAYLPGGGSLLAIGQRPDQLFRKGMAMVTEFKRSTGKHSLYPVAEQLHTFTFDPLPLQLGCRFGPVTLAYETSEHSTLRETTPYCLPMRLQVVRTRTMQSARTIPKWRGGTRLSALDGFSIRRATL